MPVISGSCSPSQELYGPDNRQTTQGCPNSCAGCGGRIVDRFYLLAVDRQWHVNCLKCCECKSQLDSELTCFARDGNIYCKDDYYRLFAVKRCARCQRGIFASELVMRARDLVYHLHCFTCAWCNAALTQGDYFGLRDNLVYCRAHYELLVHGETFTPASGATAPLTPLSQDSRCSPPLPTAPFAPYQHVQHPVQGGSVRKGRPRKRKTGDVTGSDATHPIGVSNLDPVLGLHALTPLESAGSGGNMHQQRTKRMRTSFKHHQLRTMKSYFAINQNPDAKDLKQLAQKTGLSKRVLQVWFQNARAKWRRNNLKHQDSQHQHPHSHHQHHGPCSPGAVSSFSEASPLGPDPGAPGTPLQSNGLTPPLTALDYSAAGGGESMQHISALQELF